MCTFHAAGALHVKLYLTSVAVKHNVTKNIAGGRHADIAMPRQQI